MENKKKLVRFLSTKRQQLLHSFNITKRHVLFEDYTGRSKIEELSKTEKTMLGTVFETVIKKELNIMDGATHDCKLEDFEYDIKFTCKDNWMIPPEHLGSLCVVACGRDDSLKVGVFRASEAHLNKGENRDKKRTVSAQGKQSIEWVM